jgi:hypothetical protein
MRENRLSGSEGGATLIPSSLPLSISETLRHNAISTADYLGAYGLPQLDSSAIDLATVATAQAAFASFGAPEISRQRFAVVVATQPRGVGLRLLSMRARLRLFAICPLSYVITVPLRGAVAAPRRRRT